MPPKQQQQKGARKAGGGAQAAAAAPPAETYDASRDPPTAVIIADSFTDEMKPLTQRRPRALMPVGNVPLIEYALELLVVNGIREVRVVTYFGAEEIERHLETTVTYTGKTWTNSSEIKVQVLRGSSGINSLSAALVDVLHKNQLPERFLLLPVDTLTTARNLGAIYHNHARRAKANPAYVLSVAVLESATQLMDAHASCVQRAIDATAGVQSPNTVNSAITADFNASVALRAPQAGDVVETVTDQEYVTIAFEPQNGNAIVAYQSWPENERAVARELGQQAARDPSAVSQAVVTNAHIDFTVTRKADTVVRTDLINTGILVVSQQFVSEVLQQEAMVSTLDDFMRYFVDNPGYCSVHAAVDFLSEEPAGHVTPLAPGSGPGALGATLYAAAVAEHEGAGGSRAAAASTSPVPEVAAVPSAVPVPPAPAPVVAAGAAQGSRAGGSEFLRLLSRGRAPAQRCAAVSVRSIPAYISASIAVCERRFFPFTRESNFADPEPYYAVWRYLPNVYAHVSQRCRLGASMELGPNVIIGEDCEIAPTAVVAGSVLGARCKIGPNAVVLHSVLHDDVEIGERVTVSHSALGSGVRLLAEGFTATRVVAGDGVVVTPRSNGQAPDWPPGKRVYVPASTSAASSKDRRDTALVGAKGLGVTPPASLSGDGALGGRLMLDSLFTRDVVADVGSDDEDEEEDKNEVLFEAVSAEMDTAVTQEQALDGCFRSWKMLMIQFWRGTDDLACAITRALLTFVCDRQRGEEPKAVGKAVNAVIKKWCHPVFRELLHRKGEDRTKDMFGVLRGFALALATEQCAAIRPRAAVILSCFYATADKELFERAEHCIVSYDAIIAFDDILRANPAELAGEYDAEAIQAGWQYVADYVGELRD